MKQRISLEYFVLDVFSDKSYKGNPLSVVFTNGNLELIEYQNISKEFGYSETSFIHYSPEQKALDVRSFTPTGVEVGPGESRFFNPLIGINEDAATGTAAGPLMGFLAKNNYIQLNKQYRILQGVKLNQPSLIETMVRDGDILVGGTSCLTMRGEIYL